MAEDRVGKAHDCAVALGENRPGPRVRGGQARGPQRQQVPGGVAVEEGVGEGAAVVPLPAVGVQRGDFLRVARARRPESQLG
jgi:hypothetical protein